MAGISHFYIKPLVLSRLECTEHTVWPTWGNPPPSNQRQKSGDAILSSPGVDVFVFVLLFPRHCQLCHTHVHQVWILERFRTCTIDAYWKVALNTLRVIFILIFTDN